MATGSPGTNGVWQYGEDDSEATFSALLNKAASTTDTQIGADRTRLTALEAKAPGTTGQPFTMAAGTISQTTTTAYQNTFYSIGTYTFPSGRFSVAPIMVANVGGGGYGWASAHNVSSTGFQIWLFADTNSTTRSVHYHAIQMTSTTAAG
jgi:hypothetical protein